MKKLIYLGMGLALCMGAALLTGCEEKPLEEPATDNGSVAAIGENYVETAFGMSLQMVAVQGGMFMMGATPEQGDEALDNEKPAHSVTLDGFYIGAFEVTQAQWAAVMGTTIELQLDKVAEDWEHNGDVPVEWKLYGVGDNYPMYYVSWFEAQVFCNKLSEQTGKKYRLPTEAEWEYAARGGQQADGTKYAGSNNIDEVAWYPDNGNNQTHAVGQKKPNGLGIYDMSGNVSEWCRDLCDWEYYSVSPSVNPQGPDRGIYPVQRGGGVEYILMCCRVSCREADSPVRRSYGVGFRVVCER